MRCNVTNKIYILKLIGLVALLSPFWACSDPMNTDDDDAPLEPIISSPLGSWKFADDSDWWSVKSDGTFISKKFTGSWTTENDVVNLSCTTELVNGVRIGYTATRTWYYAVLDGKLYKDSTPFIRVDERSGLTGIFERVEYRDDMSAFVKVQMEISTGPDTLAYRMYANTDNDYDEATGIGTWGTTPIAEITGNIAVLPSATTGVVYELAISGITPVTPEFPDGVYWVNGVATEENTKTNTEVSSCSDIQAVEDRVYTTGSVTSSTRGVLGMVRKNGADGPDNDMYDLPALSEPKESRTADIQILASGDVLVGGDSMNASDIRIPGYWKNRVWVELPRISTAKSGSVSAI